MSPECGKPYNGKRRKEHETRWCALPPNHDGDHDDCLTTYTFVRLEPVVYRTRAASVQEATAALESGGGARDLTPRETLLQEPPSDFKLRRVQYPVGVPEVPWELVDEAGRCPGEWARAASLPATFRLPEGAAPVRVVALRRGTGPSQPLDAPAWLSAAGDTVNLPEAP